MEMRDFLCMVGEHELFDRGVMQKWGKYGYMLQGKNLYYLLHLMRDRNVELLTHGDVWSLNVNGDFVNSTAPLRLRSGNVSQLEHKECRFVFIDKNPVINPFYIPNPE